MKKNLEIFRVDCELTTEPRTAFLKKWTLPVS